MKNFYDQKNNDSPNPPSLEKNSTRKKSQTLWENAKKAVEIFVEEDEEKAEKFLENTEKKS